MNIIISTRNKNISVYFYRHIVRIVTDDELAGLLAHQAEEATTELVSQIKKQYADIFKTEFGVSDDSLAVEIWGHVYADEFADWLKKLSDIGLIDKAADIIIRHANIIDIGEKGYDNNRFFWDGLAHVKSLIASFLP